MDQNQTTQRPTPTPVNGYLPIQERERVTFRCPGCKHEFSMTYLRPRDEKIHNRPHCDECMVPFEIADAGTIEERTQ